MTKEQTSSATALDLRTRRSNPEVVWSLKGPSLVVPLMLFLSSMIMALAWLGHLRFKEYPFVYALLACWLLVLPEYALNVSAIRWGHKVYSGAHMAAFNLCSGVFCVALVARFVLGEELTTRKLVGFVLMAVAMYLLPSDRQPTDEDEYGDEVEAGLSTENQLAEIDPRDD